MKHLAVAKRGEAAIFYFNAMSRAARVSESLWRRAAACLERHGVDPDEDKAILLALVGGHVIADVQQEQELAAWASKLTLAADHLRAVLHPKRSLDLDFVNFILDGQRTRVESVMSGLDSLVRDTARRAVQIGRQQKATSGRAIGVGDAIAQACSMMEKWNAEEKAERWQKAVLAALLCVDGIPGWIAGDFDDLVDKLKDTAKKARRGKTARKTV